MSSVGRKEKDDIFDFFEVERDSFPLFSIISLESLHTCMIDLTED